MTARTARTGFTGFTGRLRPVGSWTLRARLVASLVSVLTVVCLVIGAVTVVALRSFLLHQLDDRLTSASNRSVQIQGRPGTDDSADSTGGSSSGTGSTSGTGGTGGTATGTGGFGRSRFPGGLDADGIPGSLYAPGQGEGTFAAQLSGGLVQGAGDITASGTRARVVPTAAATRALLALERDASPHTVTLPGLGDYRVVAVAGPDGTTQVTGLPLSPVSSTLHNLALTITLVALVGVGVAVLLLLVVVRLSLRPLRRVAATATRVSQLRLDQGEVELPVRVPAGDTDPRTEVGQVGSALNHMIGHVESALAARQASEMRVRHFVADASHELRTPLAAIRGYAELTRPQRAEAPPQMAHAMERVESAAERMTQLVEDLLLLARLDSGRAVEPEPVDLSEVVIGALSDAHAAAPDHTWRLDLPEEPVVVEGDRLQLHQVVANLLANARTHTPPGTIVSVSLRAGSSADRGVQVTVSDDGPGIPESLRPNVFERFARGDTSRSRAAGSSGLGLAIVSSVVAAHGGHVDLTSAPGQTRFTVWLPPQEQARLATADA